jgi:hypothetical protein
MLGLRHVVIAIAPFAFSCGDDVGDTTETLPDDNPSSGVLSGPTPPGGQPCDNVTSFCQGGFCNTQQQCGAGFCLATPIVCNGDCTGVCGCDGNYHCNACVAHQFGTDVDLGATCVKPAPFDLPIVVDTVPQRIQLLRMDTVLDLCLVVTLEITEDAGSLPFAVELPETWALRSIVVTDHALDCGSPSVCGMLNPVGESADAVDATGSVEIAQDAGVGFPISVSTDLTLDFGELPWLEAPIHLGYQGLGLSVCFPP